MNGIKVEIDNVNFDASPDYTLVTFRAPNESHWYAGEYLIRQAFSVNLEVSELRRLSAENKQLRAGMRRCLNACEDPRRPRQSIGEMLDALLSVSDRSKNDG